MIIVHSTVTGNKREPAGNLCLVTSTGGGLCGRTYRGYKWCRHDFRSMPRQDPRPVDIAAPATAILINEEPGLTISDDRQQQQAATLFLPAPRPPWTS